MKTPNELESIASQQIHFYFSNKKGLFCEYGGEITLTWEEALELLYRIPDFMLQAALSLKHFGKKYFKNLLKALDNCSRVKCFYYPNRIDVVTFEVIEVFITKEDHQLVQLKLLDLGFVLYSIKNDSCPGYIKFSIQDAVFYNGADKL